MLPISSHLAQRYGEPKAMALCLRRVCHLEIILIFSEPVQAPSIHSIQLIQCQ